MQSRINQLALSWIVTAVLLCAPPVMAQDPAAEGTIEIADGKIVLKAPADWKLVPKKNNVIAYEFAGPADAEKDQQARITVSTSGGGLDANIQRWYTQFEQADGSSSADKAQVEKLEVAGQRIHIIQLAGTFLDKGGAGPFQQAPAVKKENYELLGGIIETKEMGMHFFKITGPTESVRKLKAGFRKMLEAMEVKK